MMVRPFTNPLTIGTLIGLLLSITGWTLPPIVADPVELIGAMAVPGMLLAYGIALRLGTTASRIDRRDGALTVTLADGGTVQTDIVLSAVGLRPSTALAAACGLAVNRGIVVLIPPDTSRKRTTRRNWDGGHYDFMRRVLASERGGELYRKRQPMIEPVFAQMKFNRGLDRFRRRGRGAVRTEWRLITATHNLLKLHRHALAAA